MIDIQGIMKCLPHRYPFLLVDRVLELEPGEGIHAIKNVTFNEPCFTGHFPGQPVFPGVLIIEALAQAGGIFALREISACVDEKLLLFRGIDKAKFRRTVVPGDQLHLHCEVLRRKRMYWTFSGVAKVEGEVAAEAELSALIADRGPEP
jgi:3-hydroxyacyl-[acyl-carrier-protein] dehydratase